MRMTVISLASISLLAACNGIQLNSSILGGQGAPAAAELQDPVLQPAPGVDAAEADPALPAAPSFRGSATTVASLGDPSLPGLWMETPLVAAEQQALVRTSRNTQVVLTLKPAPGAESGGSRLSIGAMRALSLPLTELAEVQVLPAG
ncbi:MULTISPECIES: hypothetical protein [unclassified Leisingera]|uniref:hypothetical protein n=1 Tax=unclassified Leisingera TaxID=2614906 RepID=UPI001010EEB3|nr:MULTISPECIES: hypothetical protein [unclassified Leisingera]MBQ4823767.1 hypothetical protein [Leisingera sp. HS039]MCF6430126.1 hypothetical protein [Leisingera sp. MMG026]QAX30182.1 hypothetical protein ETW24_12880 [Leisingera sp. NJS204]QBR35880.1 hypothetical protein ETW23_06725 [Leisingera sp. NJS201]